MVEFPKDRITAQDVAIFDDNAASLGIPKSLLMESAGCQAAEIIRSEYKLDSNSRVVIFCGVGNNGGDGFVIARHLASHGIKTIVIMTGDPLKIRTEEARLNWNILENLPINISLVIFSDPSIADTVKPLLQKSNLLIDCLLGTGVQGKLREPISTAIDIINQASLPVICIDVPSGMDPDTGKVLDKAVKCDFLITFHRQKLNLAHIQNQRVVSIGMPPEAGFFIGDGDLFAHFPKRKKDNFKGQYGKVLVIGGSSSYSGAPTFAALATLEFGVDLCIAMVPKSISSVVRSFSPNLIIREGQDAILTSVDLTLAKELITWADAVLIGPGMGLDPKSGEFFDQVLRVLIQQTKPTVIDADGLKFLGKVLKDKKISIAGAPLVLTPHMGELRALFLDQEIKLPSTQDILSRGKNLNNIVNLLGGGIILLKGQYDYISDGQKFRINTSGCPEMAVGGTGDVLAGLVLAFLGTGIDHFAGACCAAYINGKLGESAINIHGHRIQALDLIHQLRPFLKSKLL